MATIRESIREMYGYALMVNLTQFREELEDKKSVKVKTGNYKE